MSFKNKPPIFLLLGMLGTSFLAAACSPFESHDPVSKAQPVKGEGKVYTKEYDPSGARDAEDAVARFNALVEESFDLNGRNAAAVVVFYYDSRAEPELEFAGTSVEEKKEAFSELVEEVAKNTGQNITVLLVDQEKRYAWNIHDRSAQSTAEKSSSDRSPICLQTFSRNGVRETSPYTIPSHTFDVVEMAIARSVGFRLGGVEAYEKALS